MRIAMFMVRVVMEVTMYENNNVYGSRGHGNNKV